MIATLWIVEIISVMFLILAHEFGGIVMMPISQKLAIYQKRFILERATNQLKKRKLMSGSKDIFPVVYIIT